MARRSSVRRTRPFGRCSIATTRPVTRVVISPPMTFVAARQVSTLPAAIPEMSTSSAATDQRASPPRASQAAVAATPNPAARALPAGSQGSAKYRTAPAQNSTGMSRKPAPRATSTSRLALKYGARLDARHRQGDCRARARIGVAGSVRAPGASLASPARSAGSRAKSSARSSAASFSPCPAMAAPPKVLRPGPAMLHERQPNATRMAASPLRSVECPAPSSPGSRRRRPVTCT